MTHTLIHTYAHEVLPLNPQWLAHLVAYYVDKLKAANAARGAGYRQLAGEAPHFMNKLWQVQRRLMLND